MFKVILSLFILIFSYSGFCCYGQGKISRNTQSSGKNSHTKLNVSGSINGHDYVDLGLPSGNLWATENIGSTSPTDYGDYFAWAEIFPKEEYSIFTSKSQKWVFRDLRNDSDRGLYVKAPTDYIIVNPEYDAAKAKWGGNWQLPSKKDFEELVSKCKWKKITIRGKKGFVAIGPNGNKIFFPLAGYMEKAGPVQLKCEELHGVYWTGDYNESSDECLSYAFCLYHPQYNKGITPHTRYCGHNIRPLIIKK